jgi:hypothetical protein
MRKFTFVIALLLGAVAAKAQHKISVSTFDTLTLPTNDTYYVNHTDLGNDVGFKCSDVHFNCKYEYDPVFMYTFHKNGFVYSNKKDLIDTTYTNPYTCIGGKGYNNSDQYAVAFWDSSIINLTGIPNYQRIDYSGFYINNTIYTRSVIKYGGNGAKPFGGPSGDDPDYFKVVIYGYKGGVIKSDSVEVFLADYTSPDNTKDTILQDWTWVSLMKLGKVDSLMFLMRTTDVGQFGPNTPYFFAMDDFTTFMSGSVHNAEQLIAKVYPNPATTTLYIDNSSNNITHAAVYDMTGKLISTHEVKDKVTSIPVADLAPGIYMLQLKGEEGRASMRFVKQ